VASWARQVRWLPVAFGEAQAASWRPGRDLVCVFTGSMDLAVNERAALWFAEQVLPRLRASIPEARFQVVGRRPSPRLQAAAQRLGFLVTGEVPSVDPYIQAASHVVVPMPREAGIKIKLLEALSHGALVVTTPACADAAGVTAEREVLAADGAQEMADAIISSHQDPATARRVATAGHGFFQAHNTRATAGQAFLATLQPYAPEAV